MKVSVVTACGNKKETIPLPAWQLYKSPRIKAVYNRKGDNDMFILSAEHGLIPAEKVPSPYNRLMAERRCNDVVFLSKKTENPYINKLHMSINEVVNKESYDFKVVRIDIDGSVKYE